MTIIEKDFADIPLRAPDEREVRDTLVVLSATPHDDKILSPTSVFRQEAVPGKKTLISCILSCIVLGAVSAVALSSRGSTYSDDSKLNASPGTVRRFTTSTNSRIGAPSWNQLSSQLSNGAFQVSEVDDWLDQCVHPFAANLNVSDPSDLIRTYQLLEEPSGMCMVHVNCAYKECEGPFLEFGFSYNSSVYTDYILKSAKGLDLPDATVHPIHVGDVSKAIKFAAENKIEVSVKTSGHSYTGASTKKGSILLNLSRLQKYSPSGSIVECDTGDLLEGAFQEACSLALARDKTAFVRVGGGEIWDEALRAVSFDWNNNSDNSRKYHMVSGAAGTVSAAGGWLASGGLAGNNNMRSFGVGVDQVLHVEMVLPSGVHVRFGPTDWEKDIDMMYPRTTAVTGYCNKGDLSNEDSWDWEECSIEISFNDLWYAVRGGGGGAYGVITSIYYQLHEYSPLQSPSVDIGNVYILLNSIGRSEEATEFVLRWIEFVLRFFFDPASINVTESASNSCSSPDAGGFFGGQFICFDGAGDVMKAAWESFLFLDDFLDFLEGETLPEYFFVRNFDSWAHVGVELGEGTKTPDGRLSDEGPSPHVYNTFGGNNQYMMVPEDILITKRDEMVTMIFECMVAGTCGSATMYIMGGEIPAADDGMNSLPPHRRHGAFLFTVNDPTTRTKFNRFFNGISEGEVWTGESFPGNICHNHASLDFPTPLKEDWALLCDPSWTKEEKEEKCMSYQEASWGTDILKKLNRIHTSVDPDHLFNPDDGARYALSDEKGTKSSKKSAKKDKSKSTKSTKDWKHSKKSGDGKSTKKSKKAKKSWEY